MVRDSATANTIHERGWRGSSATARTRCDGTLFEQTRVQTLLVQTRRADCACFAQLATYARMQAGITNTRRRAKAHAGTTRTMHLFANPCAIFVQSDSVRAALRLFCMPDTSKHMAAACGQWELANGSFGITRGGWVGPIDNPNSD